MYTTNHIFIIVTLANRYWGPQRGLLINGPLFLISRLWEITSLSSAVMLCFFLNLIHSSLKQSQMHTCFGWCDLVLVLDRVKAGLLWCILKGQFHPKWKSSFTHPHVFCMAFFCGTQNENLSNLRHPLKRFWFFFIAGILQEFYAFFQ